MSTTYALQSGSKHRKVASNPKSQHAEGWTFVNLSEPNQSKDKSLRKFVRSNAMRDYRHKKKQNDSKHQRQPEDAIARQEVDHISLSPKLTLPIVAQDDEYGGCLVHCGHVQCEQDCRSTSSRVRSSPKQLLGDGGIDPFDASPLGGGSQYKGYVLNHCELPLHSPPDPTCDIICMEPLTLESQSLL